MPRNEVVIRFVLPRWSRRRLGAIAATLAGMGALVAVAAPMWPYVSPTYKPGDKMSSVTLNGQLQQIGDNLNDADARIKALQTQITQLQGSPDCPAGYTKDNGLAAPLVLCKRGTDEMVKVGSGPSAFWIDRYEASVWSNPDGTGNQYGANGAVNYPATFNRQGQRNANYTEAYAQSQAGVAPSSSLTWFQMQQACRASGKRLPSDEEWLAAASGTPDAGNTSGAANGECVFNAGGPRVTGGANVVSQTHCVSAWGAQDMIGNLWEWTADWYMGTGDGVLGASVPAAFPWSGGGGEFTVNVNSYVMNDAGSFVKGLPSTMGRGGAYQTGVAGGIFAMGADRAPSNFAGIIGFRCAIGSAR